MKRKMGMTLMIIGVLCFIVGFALYSSNNKGKTSIDKEIASVEPKSNNFESTTATRPVIAKDTIVSASSLTPHNKNSDELEQMIEMAIVDGVLTPKERNLIKDLAQKKGLNYDSIIQDVEQKLASLNSAETEIIDINLKNGIDFEKFVVQKFDRRFVKVKEWAGDKYVKGIYAQTTQHPDLLLEIKLGHKTAEFSVECKWRSNLYNNGIEFATPEQLKRYQEFERSKNVPVFIAIGIGGKGESPNQLYVVPLRYIKSNYIPVTTLSKYNKSLDKNFYYDLDNKKLY